MNRHPTVMPPPEGGHYPGPHYPGHRYRVRIYYEDTDAGGVVYHANYLRLAERARTELMRDIGRPHAEMTRLHGVMFVVRRVELDYLAPARLDDSLSVLTRPDRLGAACVALRQTFLREETEATDGAVTTLAALRITLACVRAADQRPARIPPSWRAAFAALVAENGAAENGLRGRTD